MSHLCHLWLLRNVFACCVTDTGLNTLGERPIEGRLECGSRRPQECTNGSKDDQEAKEDEDGEENRVLLGEEVFGLVLVDYFYYSRDHWVRLENVFAAV